MITKRFSLCTYISRILPELKATLFVLTFQSIRVFNVLTSLGIERTGPLKWTCSIDPHTAYVLSVLEEIFDMLEAKVWFISHLNISRVIVICMLSNKTHESSSHGGLFIKVQCFTAWLKV